MNSLRADFNALRERVESARSAFLAGARTHRSNVYRTVQSAFQGFVQNQGNLQIHFCILIFYCPFLIVSLSEP